MVEVTARGQQWALDECGAELQRVLDSELFSKRPVMSKLLAYLAHQTSIGNCDLRSYQVAVEGLGRNADYDPATDSYARVHVGRLRAALEAYYARQPDHTGMCLHIPHGTYVVKLAPRSVAYRAIAVSNEQRPPVFRRADDDTHISPGAHHSGESEFCASGMTTPPLRPRMSDIHNGHLYFAISGVALFISLVTLTIDVFRMLHSS